MNNYFMNKYHMWMQLLKVKEPKKFQSSFFLIISQLSSVRNLSALVTTVELSANLFFSFLFINSNRVVCILYDRKYLHGKGVVIILVLPWVTLIFSKKQIWIYVDFHPFFTRALDVYYTGRITKQRDEYPSDGHDS